MMRLLIFIIVCNLCLSSLTAQPNFDQQKPNILWIVVEDMSAHFSCYGETTIQTPNIDKLASEGMLFENAYVTAPVCSPSRSAMISGMYQSTLGAQNHRSQMDSGKGETSPEYFPSYKVPEKLPLLPGLFQKAGYFTVMDGSYYLMQGDHVYHPPTSPDLGKSDYNFIWDTAIYNGNDWNQRKEGQPFFAQIQLYGGKKREVELENPVDPADVDLPPYYPDTPVMRKDWAEYLNAILFTDQQLGQIMERLEEEGIADNTIVFFFTDHGISHIRGKQFLYDEGIKIPLIVRWPDEIKPGSTHSELINHLDISATSLGMAGISIPGYIQGQDIFAENYTPREEIFSGRDRCDETVDVIRSIRTKKYKYIRNYYAHRSHAQANQYKDNKEIMIEMRRLNQEGKLDSIQASMFTPNRPPEELYELSRDPYEMHNLAGSHQYQKVLAELRKKNIQYEENTRDMGLIPEPILEDLGKAYGNKYFILQHKEHQKNIDRIRQVIRYGDEGEINEKKLLKVLKDKSPAVRYWAATALGNVASGTLQVKQSLESALQKDTSATVRIALALALFKNGKQDGTVETIAKEMKNDNALARLYAILALEETGDEAMEVMELVKSAQKDDYEYVRRVARRMTSELAKL